MADAVTLASALVLRYLHIVFGIVWIGAVAYGVGVLRRALPQMEPPARKAALRRLIPILVQYIPGAAVMTILTGALLYGVLGGWSPALMFGTPWGLVLLAALALALTTFAIGMLVGVRTAKRILAHLEEEACTHQPEVGALQARFNRANVVVLFLGMAILALMVAATTKAI